ncbi:DMT family transporter [Allitabrizicola rongguiensis]|uniref:DMT family transporter n=1 Tax=Alitabrizicola rongguiensis TaxID=2909234 RepID=UPI0029E7E766|nr:DMT family transporter [Tabrizicola rongguiensis]
MSHNLRGAIYMNIAMAAFTLNDTGMKAVTQTLPLFEAITLRGASTSLLLFLLGLALGGLRLRLPRRDAGLLGIRTLAEIVATVAFLGALVHMPLANLSAIMQFTPLAVTLAAALLFRESIGWRRLTAIGIGFLGVLLVIRPGAQGFDVWALVGVASVLCVVVRDLSTRKFGLGVPTITVALTAALGVMALGLAGVAIQGWRGPEPRDLLIVFGSSVALVAGYLSGVQAMRAGDIGFIAPFRYTSLLWAIALGWLVFGTLPDVLTMAGASVVIATGLFTLLRERKLAQDATKSA